jgi:hypothetical protein
MAEQSEPESPGLSALRRWADAAYPDSGGDDREHRRRVAILDRERRIKAARR